MLKNRQLLFTILILLLLILTNSSAKENQASSEKDAKDAINAAQRLIIKCYEAALRAEEAGANITGLLEILNDAAWHLSKATIEYKNKNFNAAIELTDKIKNELEGFVSDAEELRDKASKESYWDFMINIVGSSVGAATVIFVSLAVWVWLSKKRSNQKEDSR